MEAELEHDMQGGEVLGAGMGVADAFGDAGVLDDEEDCACCSEETQAEDDGCCDEEDPLAAPGEEDAEEDEQEQANSGMADEEESSLEGGAALGEGEQPAKKKKKKKARAQSVGTRLDELSRPRQPRAEPSADPKPATQIPEKKPQTTRPSLLLRLRPTNLEEAMEAFFQSGFSVAPQFTYAFPEDYVTKHFQENSNVCFELLPEARRILQRVQDEYGGPEPFMQKLYGEEKVSAEDLRDTVAVYLQEHNIEDKVEIRIVDNMLAAANVVKPSPDEKYVVNIARGPISKNMVQGICDHEVGTHLLRMMNDEYQVWHGRRDRYRLLNPWTTEEGFATLNTYISMPCKLLYPQALRYYAVCQGARLGFVELFHEIHQHISDPKRCWQMCCRIKRGMIDTSQPGAFYMDQAYFKGAVEILRHLNEIDFGRLYAGQIALQDLDKVYFLLRKEIVRLPRFLNTPDKLKTYLAHCRRLIKENQIEAATERVCKPVFIRAAKELFKQKPKAELRATIAIAAPGAQGPGGDGARGVGRSLDLSRLEDLARPRPAAPAESDASEAAAGAKRRDCDLSRLAELALPRTRAESEEPSAGAAAGGGRAPDLSRILDLARPRQLVGLSAEVSGTGGTQHREFSRNRMLELALPRPRACNEADAAELPQRPAAQKTQTALRRGASAPPPLEGAERPPASAGTEAGEDEGGPLDPAAAESGGESAGDEVPAPAVRRKSRRSRHRSRPKATRGAGATLESVPPPPEPIRPPDQARLAALAVPRKVCAEEQSGQPCECAPKTSSKKRRRSKLRLLALVQAKQEQADNGEFLPEPSPRDGAGVSEVQDDSDEVPELQARDPTAEASPPEAAAPAPLPEAPPSRGSPAPQEAPPEAKPLSRAAQRSQSLGARAGAEPPAAAWQHLAGFAPAPLPGPGPGGPSGPSGPSGLGAQRPLGTTGQPEVGQGGQGAHASRKPRVAHSLPRPSAILPRAAMAAMATMAGGSDGAAWKTVPIKTMQLQLAL